MKELNFDNLQFGNRERNFRRNLDETMFMRRHFGECLARDDGDGNYKIQKLAIEKPEYNTLSMGKYYDEDA